MRIFVAAHKPVNMLPDTYEIVQAGASLNPHFADLTDDSGINISALNPSYCEMTVLYWIWKNVSPQNVSMVHYRRFFMRNPWTYDVEKALSPQEMDSLLQSCDMLVPESYSLGMTVYEDFEKFHNIKDLNLLYQYIANHEPNYRDAFNQVINQKTLRLCNMFAARWDCFDRYMTWLFPILDYCYQHIDTKSYDSYNQRLIGFLAERLFNVWLTGTPGIIIKALPVAKVDGSVVLKRAKTTAKFLRHHLSEFRIGS